MSFNGQAFVDAHPAVTFWSLKEKHRRLFTDVKLCNKDLFLYPHATKFGSLVKQRWDRTVFYGGIHEVNSRITMMTYEFADQFWPYYIETSAADDVINNVISEARIGPAAFVQERIPNARANPCGEITLGVYQPDGRLVGRLYLKDEMAAILAQAQIINAYER